MDIQEYRTLQNETAEISELLGIKLRLEVMKDALFLDVVDEEDAFVETLLEFATLDQVDVYLKALHWIGHKAKVAFP